VHLLSLPTYADFGGYEQCNDKSVDGDGFTEDDADKILGCNGRCSNASPHDARASVVDTTELNHGQTQRYNICSSLPQITIFGWISMLPIAASMVSTICHSGMRVGLISYASTNLS